MLNHIIIAVILFLNAGRSLGQTSISVNQQLNGQLFGSSMSVLEDETAKLTINEIANPKYQRLFSPLNQDSPRFGFTKSTLWIKFILDNSSSAVSEVLIESRYTLLDYLNLYAQDESGNFKVQKLGDRNPYGNRLIEDRLSVFALSVPPGQSAYYLEVSTSGSVNVPLHFWSPTAFHKFSKQQYQIVGLVLGFLGVMLLYNLFLAVSFQSRSYALYAFYILSFISYQLGVLGIGKEILPDNWIGNFTQNTGLLFSIQGANFFACLFAISFLDLKLRMPRSYRILIVLCSTNAVIMAATLFADYNVMARLVNFISGITAIMLIINGIVNIVSGYRPAVFFTLAWVGILLGNVAFALSVAGIIPVSFFTTWGQSLGGSAEVVLLSLALGDRVNFIRSNHENKIKTLNKELQHHIEDIEEIVAEKTRDIKSIMTNLHQGIFTIHPDPSGKSVGVVGDDYSLYLVDMLGETNVSQRDVMELVFEKSNLDSDTKNRISEVLRACLDEDVISFGVNSDNLVSEFKFKNDHGSEKIIEIDWSPVADAKGDRIEKILVSLRDVTHLRELQTEAKLQQDELECIGEILKVEGGKFNKFIDSAYKYIEENNRLIAHSQERNDEILKILFINMHTIKGVARSFYLSKLTDLLHSVERTYALLQKDPNHPWDKSKLESDMERVCEMFDRYNSININKLNRGSEKNKISLEKSFIRQKYSLLGKLNTSLLSASDQAIISDTREAFAELFYQNSEKVFSEIFSIVDALSRDLGKEKPHIAVINPGFSISDEGSDILQNVFVHVIRNSIDHGLETGTERIKKGKLPEGNITINLSENSGFMEIYFSDDGAGLNLKKLRQLGLARSYLSEEKINDPMAVAHMIFEDGLSTAPQVSDVSGRGVGMSAVKRYIEQAGGKLRLCFNETPSIESTGVAFGIVISLPSRYYNYIPCHHAA